MGRGPFGPEYIYSNKNPVSNRKEKDVGEELTGLSTGSKHSREVEEMSQGSVRDDVVHVFARRDILDELE